MFLTGIFIWIFVQDTVKVTIFTGTLFFISLAPCCKGNIVKIKSLSKFAPPYFVVGIAWYVQQWSQQTYPSGENPKFSYHDNNIHFKNLQFAEYRLLQSHKMLEKANLLPHTSKLRKNPTLLPICQIYWIFLIF